MTILTLLTSELRRLTATKLGVLSFVALLTVPLLYGGLYLWGNRDPYGELRNVPAGLVVADRGATVGGSRVDYGRSVADRLEQRGDFAWHELTAVEAARQVRSGAVDFVVTFPAGFSADLASGGSASNPSPARISLTTNDANGYLATTIAERATDIIRSDIAREVGTGAAKRLLAAVADIRSNLSDAAGGATSLASGADSTASGAATLASGASSVDSGARSVAAGAARADAAAGRLAAGARSVASGSSDLAAGAKRTAAGATDLRQGLDTLDGSGAGMGTAASSIGSGASRVASGASALWSGAARLASGLAKADAASGATATALERRLGADGLTPAQIREAVAVLQPGASAVHSAATAAGSLTSGAASVASGGSAVASGAGRLAAAAPRLTDGIAAAVRGARSLESGAASVAAGARKVASGSKAAATGAGSLRAGLDGLERGSATVAGGAGSVAKGVSSLRSGTASVATGAGKLATSLRHGVTAIPATTEAQRTAQAAVIVDPARVAQTAVTSAGTYGAGLAPFFLTLSAWIGAYALFLILRPLSRRALTAVRAPIRITLAGWLTPALLGAVQMVTLFAIAAGVLGLAVVHPVAMVAVMALSAVTFAAILLLLNAALGSVGQFLGLILMLVQLVTAGGTFPWQTLPGPLAAVHRFLPMSYGVDALRQVMYGGDLARAWADAAVLGLWLVAALALTAATALRMTRHRTLRDLRPSLIGG